MNLASEIGRLAADGADPLGPELLPKRLMNACADLLPIAAAGVSMFLRSGHRVPLAGSSADAVTAERLQFTVGEGPCFAAQARRGVVIAPSHRLAASWPAFNHELNRLTGFRSIVSVPAQLGPEVGVALDFYYRGSEMKVRSGELAQLKDAATIVVALLMSTVAEDPRPLPDGEPAGPAWLESDSARSRFRVWVAMGMVNCALDLDDSDALAVLRGYAYGHDMTVDHLAQQITARTLPVQSLIF